MERWFVDGEWIGQYSYDAYGYLEPVPFRMRLRAGWFGFLHGTVQDESEKGVPDVGTIRGRITGRTITFVKQLPFLYVFRIDPKMGLSQDVRPRLADGPHPPIHYHGVWDAQAAKLCGNWVLKGYRVQTGRWTARPFELVV